MTKASLEPVREKIKRFIMSMPHEKKIEHKYVMKVKGKCLNHFLGIIKTDLPRLAVEGFPQELNKQLPSLMFLPRYDLIWFDIQIEKRIATLKANFFVGYNLKHNFYKMGFLCLIGIAHLPESMAHLKFSKGFEFRPMFTTNIGDQIESELLTAVPKNAIMVTKNLFCAIRTVAGHILHRIPISGNVRYDDEGPPQTIRPESEYGDEDDEAASRIVDMELKRRQLDEEEKYSAGGNMLGPGHKFKGMN
jgi:hypothetical protein